MTARDALPPAMITFLVLNSLAVGARCYVRLCVSKSFSYDDGAMLVAFLGYTALCAITFVSIGYGYGASEVEPGFDTIKATQFFVAATLAYCIIVYVAKVSVALVLFRIAQKTNKVIRRILIGSIVVLTVWTLVSTLTVALQCRPLSVAWGVGTGTCVDATILANTGYSISSMDIGSSILYAILPVILLRGVQLSPRVKYSIILILGLCILSAIVTIVRLKYLVDVAKLTSATGTEAANAYLTTFVYSVIEIGLTIFTASLPALRPLLKFIPLSHFGSSNNNGDKYPKNSHLVPNTFIRNKLHAHNGGSSHNKNGSGSSTSKCYLNDNLQQQRDAHNRPLPVRGDDDSDGVPLEYVNLEGGSTHCTRCGSPQEGLQDDTGYAESGRGIITNHLEPVNGPRGGRRGTIRKQSQYEVKYGEV